MDCPGNPGAAFYSFRRPASPATAFMRFLYPRAPSRLENLRAQGAFVSTAMADEFLSRAVLGWVYPAAPPGIRLSLRRKEYQMLDIVMLALGLIFFVATIAYVYACDRL